MVKKKGKKKGASLEEAFGKDKQPGDDGWTTASAAAMLMDEDEQPAAAPPDMIEIDEPGGNKKKKKQRNKQQQQHKGEAMDTGEGYTATAKPQAAGTTSRVPGLGVVTHSMKRGDRTTKQKRRKVEKLAKAMARSDKVGVRIDTKTQKKQAKVTLKHLY